MPRDSSGVYKLPAGNPVAPDTVIESDWANSTMDDVALGLTGSLARSGVAPMLGPLTLSADAITGARQAVSKEYVDSFLAYATGMPIGAVTAFTTNGVPAGWLLCNGQAVNRTTYADLYATIGTIYGSGDGVNTFNVPDLRNEFIRGLGGSNVLGTKYPGVVGPHTHGVNDPGHIHTAGDHTHAFTTGGVSANATHSHLIDDPGHTHDVTTLTSGTGTAAGSGIAQTAPASTTSSQTGIGIVGANTDHTHSGTTDVGSGNTGGKYTDITIQTSTGAETVPQHMAVNYIIKAVEDSTSTGNIVVGITSSDTQLITINSANPTSPVITPVFNVPGGMTKLDANGLVPISQIPNLTSNNLGFFDASSGNLPSGTFDSGDTYTISVSGTLTVYSPATLTAAPTVVAVGTGIQYVTGSPTNPTGWYAISITTIAAQNVSFTQAGVGAVGSSVQKKLQESVSVKDFGAVGDGTTDDTSEIQAAINATVLGGTLNFPPGKYLVSAGLVCPVSIRIVGSGVMSTELLVAATVGATVDVLTLVGSTTNPPEGFYVSDIYIRPVAGTPARHGINIGGTGAVGINRCTVERVKIDNLGSYGILNNGGFSSVIQNSAVSGIDFDAGTDNLDVFGNTLTGNFWGVRVNCVPGSNKLNIKDNVVVSKLGGVHIVNAGTATICDNQFESQVATTDPNSAMIVLEGAARDVYNTQIHGNNFNVSIAHMIRCIKLMNAVSVSIYGNTFYTGKVADGNRCIDILAQASGTLMGHNFYYVSETGGYAYSQIAGTTYEATRNPNGVILDAGFGTCGTFKDLTYHSADITHNFNYSYLGVMKDLTDRIVTLRGGVNVANVSEGKVLCILPDGFRPENDYTVMPASGRDSASGAYSPVAIRIDTIGGVYLVGTTFPGVAITEVSLDGVSFSRVFN